MQGHDCRASPTLTRYRELATLPRFKRLLHEHHLALFVGGRELMSHGHSTGQGFAGSYFDSRAQNAEPSL